MRQCLLAISFILFSGTCPAQEPWTLRRCVDYAIEHNIEIKQQEIAVKNTETELSTRRSSRLPNLNTGASQNFNFGRSQSQETGIYEDQQTSSTSVSASASIPIFSGFGITNNIRASRLNLQASLEGLKKAKDNLEIQLTRFYLDVLFKKEIFRVYEYQAGLTSGQVRRTEILVEAGKVPQSQLLDIKAQLAKDELNITNASNDLAMSLLTLAQSLNIEYKGFDVVQPELVTEEITDAASPDLIYEEAVGIRPHVREAEYRLESSRKGVLAAQASIWPSLSLGASYASGFSHILKSPGDMSSNETDPFTQLKNNQRQSLGINLNIPIFSRNQSRNQIKSARLAVESKQLELENAKLALFKEIQLACQSTATAKAKHTATEKAVQAIKEALTYARERYEVGKSTVYELSEAQTKLINARSEQLQAKYEFIFYKKILGFYRGERIEL